MTDARAARYDELYPALNGLSGNNNNSNRFNSNTSLLNNNTINNNNTANSWSAHTASGHQQTNKLNYIQTQIQNYYQQQQQQQQQSNNSTNNNTNNNNPSQSQPPSHEPQQQQQPAQQPHQQVLNHLVESNSNPMVTPHHSSHQQPQPQQSHQSQQQPQQQKFASSSGGLPTNNMQANTLLPQAQQQARRPGPPSHPMLSERFCTFKIAPEERRHRDFELEQSKILKEIMQKTSTKIEVTTTKDGALNFCIIGKERNLPIAKNLVLNDFQTGVTLTVTVPRAIYGRLLGQKGQRLATIQDETQTKITIPKKEEDSDIIKIVGLKSNAELAARAIEKYAREFAGKTVEKVTVERIYILFITGPFNENLKRWDEMGAKVSTSVGLLPSKNDRESGHADEVTFTIMGEASVVNQVKDEICKIYEDKKKKCTTVNMEVKKAQHKYILGQLGQNLRQLFAKTGVSVELPHESESETITLRGERSKMAQALSELYTQAHSETDDYFEVESWLHKYLIGSRKTHFLDFKTMGVDVKSQDDKIKLHGPPSEIENIMEVFDAELKKLKRNIIRKDISVEARIHGYIIGRSGATVDQIREESGANVIVPKNDEPSELITLEGTHEAVAIAEEKINAIAKRYEASRKLVIDQQLLGSIIGRGGEKIRSIREKFSQVIFSFPEMGSKHNEITILGPADEVEECYKYLDELHQQIQENNHQIQVPIKKDVLKYLSDAKQAIKRLKIENHVKIDMFIFADTQTGGGEQASKKNKEENMWDIPAKAKGGAVAAAVAEDSKKRGAKGEVAATKGGKAGSPKQQNGVLSEKQATSVGNKTSGESYAVIIGKKEVVEAAKPKFVKLLEEFATTIEVEMKVSPNLREHLGPKARLGRMFCEEFYNKVTVVFPPAQKQQNASKSQQATNATSGDEPPSATGAAEANGGDSTVAPAKGKQGKENNRKANKEQQQQQQQQASDSSSPAFEVVKLRGPKNVVKKAEKRFEALVAECRDKIDKNFTVKLNIDADVYDKFVHTDRLILKDIRDVHNVKLHVPDKREGVKQLVCTIVGYEKDVREAQKKFERLSRDVAERVEETIEIASQVHPRLIGAQGRAVKKFMDDFKVNVKFARPADPNPNAVTLSGRQQNIKLAKAYMVKVANQYMNTANRNAAAAAAAAATAAAANAAGTGAATGSASASSATNGGEAANDAGDINNDDNSQSKPHETAPAE